MQNGIHKKFTNSLYLTVFQTFAKTTNKLLLFYLFYIKKKYYLCT